MNGRMYENPQQEERNKTIMRKYPMNYWNIDHEALLNDAPEDVVVNCEMIWTQVNQ